MVQTQWIPKLLLRETRGKPEWKLMKRKKIKRKENRKIVKKLLFETSNKFFYKH